jgi:DNA primase
MKFHGMGFREALEFLATKAGVELVFRSRAGGGDSDPASSSSTSREQLIEANAFALRFFRGLLSHPEHGAAARDVIERRGIAPEMVESFGLGAAPDRWDGLVKMAESKGIALQPLIDAGLIKMRSSGDGAFDMLRHRLIFPIFDQIGRAVAFGGRKLRDEDEPKYLNSPESRVFDKSATLFGLKQALRGIQESRCAIVTEGYTDVIACHAAGFTNAVATLGTALTRDHARVLQRLCETVILLFDGDEAGQRAADRALETFFAVPVDVRICTLPDRLDPDDLLRQPDGALRFKAALDASVDALVHLVSGFRARLAERPGAAGRQRVIEEMCQRLGSMGIGDVPALRRRTVLQELSRVCDVPVHELEAALPRPRAAAAEVVGGDGAGPVPQSPLAPVEPVLLSGPQFRARSMAERDLLAVLLAAPEVAAERIATPDGDSLPVHELYAPGVFLDPVARTLWTALHARLEAGVQPTVQDVMADVGEPTAKNLAAQLFSKGVARCEAPGGALARLTEAVADMERVIARASEPTPQAVDDLRRRIDELKAIGRRPTAIMRSAREDR